MGTWLVMMAVATAAAAKLTHVSSSVAGIRSKYVHHKIDYTKNKSRPCTGSAYT